LPLQLARQPRRLYQTNTLKQVICQVRHPYQHRYQDPAYLASFQSRLGDRFPRTAKQTQVALLIGPGGVVPAPAGPPFSGAEFWRFTDISGQWVVSVAPDFVSLEVVDFAYTRFEEFVDRLVPVLEALLEQGVSVRERLGFRFVNEIRHPDATLPADWRQFINERMLGLVAGGELGDDIIHALQEIRLRQPDGVIVIRHGYIGPEPTAGKPVYSLDLDYFNETVASLNLEDTKAEVTKFHDVLKDLFETSITDPLRAYLVVTDEAQPQ
jgi:uncharacterized protein (TIGR04255 family)